MKRIALLATILSSLAVPSTAIHAATTPTVSKQAVCIPVIVDAGDGPVEGVLCFPQDGQV
ncbi:hypothetical protein SUS17_1372 [Sphingomonas sp. S17]|jgi:hypothetical protein|uniref:Secreted protein n=1 Tax=Sphingomonas paucimobilis TaxID=13689 RepID=A0A7Y2PFC8_SPHPI|nr:MULTISPECIES: hypothetical protein [Sphingomonas]RSU67399.1 hypothetical protein BRX36_05485 [Sphingomonas sp. S-NIH.Pt1_0416]EGI55805.1 hypothetical protein SUS17_1372 [Sphingomonas sp. S17]MCM3679526.1 hypothetical protein [Sphingomonas paucimobilis]MDG5971081.1 hypothetical protein [Sphingomonas paucimobilis]NNG59768.1 hypothetical protein [Sphingomonas paucimobilis]